MLTVIILLLCALAVAALVGLVVVVKLRGEQSLLVGLATSLLPEMSVGVDRLLARSAHLFFGANGQYTANPFTRRMHVLRVTGKELAHTFHLADTFGLAGALPRAMADDFATFMRLHKVFRNLVRAYVHHFLAAQPDGWPERYADLLSQCVAESATGQEACARFAQSATCEICLLYTSPSPRDS